MNMNVWVVYLLKCAVDTKSNLNSKWNFVLYVMLMILNVTIQLRGSHMDTILQQMHSHMIISIFDFFPLPSSRSPLMFGPGQDTRQLP